MDFSSRRLLFRALFFSLLLHASLLFSVSGLLPFRLEAPGTVIRVVMGGSVHDRGESAAALKPPAGATLADVPVVRKAITPQLAVPEASPPRQVALPSAESAGRPAEPDQVHQSGATASVHADTQVSSTFAPSGAKTAGREQREGLSANDLRQYRIALASAAKRFKRYPPMARERGWEGTVEVAITFRAGLPAPDVELGRSSGRSLLDDQALETIRQAARQAVLPDGLRGKDFRDQLSIRFSLDDEPASAP